MEYENYFKDMFESLPDFGKKVLKKFSFQNSRNLLLEVGFSEHDINRLDLEFKTFLID